jgi:hypothetical protein
LTTSQWDVKDQETYKDTLHIILKNPKVHLLANNPFEEYHMRELHKMNVKNIKVARPVGISQLPGQNIEPELEGKVVIIDNFAFTRGLRNMFQNDHIDLHIIPNHYGGPITLGKYRAFLEIPYQVSAMKLYENLAYGVVIVLPTPRLWKQWMKYSQIITRVQGDTKDIPVETLEEVMDYFHPDFAKHMYYYDSIEELASIVKSNNTIDTKNVKESAPLFMKKVRNETVTVWRDLFLEMGIAIKK